MAPGPEIPTGSTIVVVSTPPFSREGIKAKDRIEEPNSQRPKQFILDKINVAEKLGRAYLKGAGNLLAAVQISAEMYMETKMPNYKETMMKSFGHIKIFYEHLSQSEINSCDETRVIMKNFDYVRKLALTLEEFEKNPSEGLLLAIKEYINNINLNGKQLTINFEKTISTIRQEKIYKNFSVPLIDYKGNRWDFPYNQ